MCSDRTYSLHCILQYFLGLLSSFQRAKCVLLPCVCCVLRFASTSTTTGSATSFLLRRLFRSALLPPLFGGEGGSFYIRCLKFVKVLFSSTYRLTGVGRDPATRPVNRLWSLPAFTRFRAAVKEADQVINHLFSCGPTVLRFNSDFVLRTTRPPPNYPPASPRRGAFQRGGAAYTDRLAQCQHPASLFSGAEIHQRIRAVEALIR